MISVVGVFRDHEAAQEVNDLLRAAGIPEDRRILLLPGASEEDMAHVPVTEAEAPVMGKVIGGLVGGALGVGAAAGVAAIPGVGPVTVIGLLGLALLGVGGTAAGVKVGDVLDDALYDGLPVDELFVYEDALRKGRSVVIALVESDDEAERARGIIAQAGAETIDAARDQWWIGLRSTSNWPTSRPMRSGIASPEESRKKMITLGIGKARSRSTAPASSRRSSPGPAAVPIPRSSSCSGAGIRRSSGAWPSAAATSADRLTIQALRETHGSR